MKETIKAIRVMGFWRVVYARTLYRPVMRWMHRHNLHYAPPAGPAYGRNNAVQQHWCQWCGLRGTVLTLPGAGLGISAPEQSSTGESK